MYVSYTHLVFRRGPVALLCVFAFVSACNNNSSKEKVQQAIMTRLQTHSGLDLKDLDVTTSSVSFDKNMAYATVSFHPKGDTSLRSQMVMKYTLEERDGKWVVIGVGDSQGHSMGGHSSTGSGQLPPGHPPVNPGEDGLSGTK